VARPINPGSASDKCQPRRQRWAATGGEGRASTTIEDVTSADGPDGTPRQHPSSFGSTGTQMAFHGPYAGGPRPDDLQVEVPPIDKFGVSELGRMIVVYVVLFIRIARALLAGLVRGRRGNLWSAASNGAIDAFEQLGPTFVKLGQIMASSPGLFPTPLAVAAQRCLDEMAPFDARTAREMIRKDLGRSPAVVFKRFDEVPLSAASIGQVHACVLPDGREAVIKLQRPNVRKQMTTDLRISYRLAKTFERRVAFARRANAVALIEEMHTVTFSELNPALEAWRQHRFREKIHAFGDNWWVTAPEIYWDYCGPHMICMERMSGIRRHPAAWRRRRTGASPRRQDLARSGGGPWSFPWRPACRKLVGAR
jgi:ABC1 atypical kinase-like domain